MLAILKKIQADLFNRRLATGLVTLTVTAATALLALTAITLSNLNQSFERSFDELNGAHLWLFFDRQHTSRSRLERIGQMPGVAASSGLQISQVTWATLGAERVPVSLRAVGVQPHAVNAVRITAGRALQTGDENGLWIDKRLAEQFHVRVGDKITLQTGRRERLLVVVGLVFNPTWDIYRTNQPPYLYVLDKTFRRLFPDELSWDWSLGLRLDDPQAVDQALAGAEHLARKQAISDHTDWRNVRDAYLFGAQLNTLLLTAFGLFALGAAAFILANSINGAVLAQFRDIGVLKSLGFTGRQVAAVYLGQNLAIGMAGGLLGLLLGLALAPLPLRSLASALDSSPTPRFDPLLLGSVWAGVQMVVLGATLWPAWRGAQTNTLRAITTGYELPSSRPSLLARLALLARLPVPLVLGAKQTFARPGRVALTLFSLVLGVIALVFSSVLNNVLAGYLRNPAMVGIVYDAWVSRVDLGDSPTRRILAAAPGIEGMLAHATAEVKTTGGQAFRIRAEEGDFNRFPYQLQAGRMLDPLADGEMIIGVGLQNWLGLAVGDALVLTVNEKHTPVTWRVVGVYREPADNGQMAIVSLNSLHKIDRLVEPDTYYLQLSPQASLDDLRAYLKAETGGDLTLAVIDLEAGGLTQFRVTLLALSAVLALVALFNVLNTALLNTREQMSEIGVYKTLGMTPGQVVAMVLTSGTILGLTAAVVGVPLGVWLAAISLNVLGGSLGFGSFDLSLTWANLLLPGLAAVLTGLLGSAVPARWAARLAVIEVLQSE